MSPDLKSKTIGKLPYGISVTVESKSGIKLTVIDVDRETGIKSEIKGEWIKVTGYIVAEYDNENIEHKSANSKLLYKWDGDEGAYDENKIFQNPLIRLKVRGYVFDGFLEKYSKSIRKSVWTYYSESGEITKEEFYVVDKFDNPVDGKGERMTITPDKIHLLSMESLFKENYQIKIIDLLTHRLGLGCYSNPGYGYGYINSIKYNNLEEFTNDLSEVVLKFEPGLKYFYGINQAVLGRVIEVVSNQTFFEFLKKELFDPLEMNETKFHLTEEERGRFQPLFINTGALKGFTYELNELSYKKNNEAYFGGEGLVSTLGDYSNFCKMLLNGGSYNGKKIISQNSINLMTKKYSQSYPNEEFADTRKLGFYYGFSLFLLENP